MQTREIDKPMGQTTAVIDLNREKNGGEVHSAHINDSTS